MRKLSALALLVVLLFPRPADAAWAIDVAWASNYDAASGSTFTFTYGSAVASGALLVCFVYGGHATQALLTDIDDNVNGGTTWTQFGGGSPVNADGIGGALSAWYYLNSAAGTPTVTATYTASVTLRGMVCGSYSGIQTSGAFDVGIGDGQTNPGTVTNAVHTGDTATTAEANELAIAVTIVAPQSTTVTTGTNISWLERLNTSWATSFKAHVEDVDIASTATVRGAWTVNNPGADSYSIVGTFKQIAAAGGCTGGVLLLGAGKCE